MKYDVETRENVLKEQEPAEKAERKEQPPGERCEDRVRFLEAVLQDMGEGVIVADRSGRVECMNHRARDMFGLRNADEGTRYFKDTSRYEIQDSSGKALPQESWPMARAERGESFRGQDVVFKDKATGRTIPAIFDAAPLKATGGKENLNVITVHERAERKGLFNVTPNLLSLLGLIAASVPETIFASGCDILLYDDREGVFKSTAAASEWQRSAVEKRAYCASEEDRKAYARRVMESKNPLVVEGTKDHPLCTAPESMANKLGVKSLIVLPLMEKNRFLGAMIVDSTMERHRMSDRDLDVLNALAKLTAAMIARAETSFAHAGGAPAAAAGA